MTTETTRLPDSTVLTPEQRATIAALIGNAQPARNSLLTSLGESIRDRSEHEHPTWEDLFCLNLVSYMGERMAPVLRRLLDAESRIAELEEQRDRRRVRLIAAEADLLAVRGLLSPAGGPRRIPADIQLHEQVAPAVEWLLIRVTELEAAPTIIYRAEHPDSGITLGHYGTAAAARAHCEAMERRTWAEGEAPVVDWIEDEEDGLAELVASIGEDERATGYVVTALEIPSEYDEEADE